MTSQVKFNTWQNTSGTPMGTIINAQMFTVPYSVTSVSSTGYTTLSSITTSNTTSMYSTTYTPVSSSSYLVINCFLAMDRGSGVNQPETCVLFVNGTSLASSFRFPRVTGHEPNQYVFTGTYTNSSVSSVSIDIRAKNGGGGSLSVGQAYGCGDQTLANNIIVYEVQR